MPRYAEKTEVTAEKSRSEIERILSRYGVNEFAYGWRDGGAAMLAFKAHDRYIRFLLPMSDKNSKEFWITPVRGTKRTSEQAYAAWEQACRQRWRALALLIKAKLEAIEAGIITFEREFETQTLLPNGQTVGDFI